MLDSGGQAIWGAACYAQHGRPIDGLVRYGTSTMYYDAIYQMT